MNALRILFLLRAVTVLGRLGWRAALQHRQVADLKPPPASAPGSVPPPPAAAPSAATAEERLAEVPEFSAFYTKLKADFPAAYAALVAQLKSRAKMPTGNAAIWDAMRGLQQSQGVLAAQAGPPALDGYFDARLAIMNGLAPLNARDCVDFLYGVINPSISDFTAAHQSLVATLADRQLAAIEDGRARHLDRLPPSAADLDALSSNLATRNVSPQEIGLLIDGTTPDPPIPDGRLCELRIVYLDVLRGLPAETRQRIYGLAVELLARS